MCCLVMVNFDLFCVFFFIHISLGSIRFCGKLWFRNEITKVEMFCFVGLLISYR